MTNRLQESNKVATLYLYHSQKKRFMPTLVHVSKALSICKKNVLFF